VSASVVVPKPVGSPEDARFWDLLNQGTFCIQECLSCGRARYPAESVCGHCLSPDIDWAPVRGTGRLLAWCTFHKQYFGCLPVPYTVVAVELAEGPIVSARLAGAGPLELDTPMRLELEPVEFDDGSAGTCFIWRIEGGRDDGQEEGES
jgi:uncharacterized OB-fold protein